VQDAFKTGITSGLHGTMIGGAVLAFLGFVVAWFVREVPLRSGRAPAASQEPAAEALTESSSEPTPQSPGARSRGSRAMSRSGGRCRREGMTTILVTGGTGVLGRQVVGRLAGRADVRVLSRRDGSAEGATMIRGDLETGEGLQAALDGVDVIVHAASIGFDLRRPDRDIGATRRLLDAISGEPHLVYISIVGVDAIPYGYYRAKLAVERMIQEFGVRWTILRTTQFHDLVLTMLALLAKGPVAVVPRGVEVQPVDTGEVAGRLVELALGEPAGRVPDMGGPRVERTEDLMRAYLTVVRRRRPVLRLPIPGRTMAAYRAGRHLTPANATGVIGFTDDLLSRIDPGGVPELPYDLRRR
jgi:uncharacterized protein YbjT (DUF2867 family)